MVIGHQKVRKKQKKLGKERKKVWQDDLLRLEYEVNITI